MAPCGTPPGTPPGGTTVALQWAYSGPTAAYIGPTVGLQWVYSGFPEIHRFSGNSSILWKFLEISGNSSIFMNFLEISGKYSVLEVHEVHAVSQECGPISRVSKSATNSVFYLRF